MKGMSWGCKKGPQHRSLPWLCRKPHPLLSLWSGCLGTTAGFVSEHPSEGMEVIAQVPSVAAEAEGPLQVGAGTGGTVLAAWAGSDVALLLHCCCSASPTRPASLPPPRRPARRALLAE